MPSLSRRLQKAFAGFQARKGDRLPFQNHAFIFQAYGCCGKPGAVTELRPSRALARPDGMRPIPSGEFIVAEGAGKISRLSIDGDTVTVTTLAEGINQPTGADVGLGLGWYVQGQLGAIFRPAEGKAELPFRIVPVSLKP